MSKSRGRGFAARRHDWVSQSLIGAYTVFNNGVKTLALSCLFVEALVCRRFLRFS